MIHTLPFLEEDIISLLLEHPDLRVLPTQARPLCPLLTTLDWLMPCPLPISSPWDLCFQNVPLSNRVYVASQQIPWKYIFLWVMKICSSQQSDSSYQLLGVRYHMPLPGPSCIYALPSNCSPFVMITCHMVLQSSVYILFLLRGCELSKAETVLTLSFPYRARYKLVSRYFFQPVKECTIIIM